MSNKGGEAAQKSNDMTSMEETITNKDQARKSKEIAITPARVRKEALATVTPADQKISKTEQRLSKKKQAEQKRTMDQYFGPGERVLPPSRGGTPVQSILLQRLTKSATGVEGQKPNTEQNDNEEKGKEANACRKKDSTTTTGNLSGQQPNTNKDNQAEYEEVAVEEEPEVDLEGFSTGVRPKGQGSRKRDKKRNAEKKTGEQVKQSEARKPKIAFTEAEKPKTISYNQCMVGFAIRVDKGNNAKQAFDKKLMEGLQFHQQYVDKNACFLPHEKDKKLEPKHSKSDMPKYQVVMKGYFCIPNNNSFINVQQESGRVVKGSRLMGFELDPQQCLEEAGGDLQSMGCSIFFKKCQQVDTVSNMIFLGVPNSVSEETVKETVDKVLQELEAELIKNDKDYKVPIKQKGKWMQYAITKEYPGGMPWEDQDEKKKKKQGSNSLRLAFIFHIHRPEEQRLKILLDRAKHLNLWHKHWGGVAFTVEQPDFTTSAGVKDRYIKMVQSHGAMQLSMGAATIPGIVTATRKFTNMPHTRQERETTGTD
jgi:hypothetical protein